MHTPFICGFYLIVSAHFQQFNEWFEQLREISRNLAKTKWKKNLSKCYKYQERNIFLVAYPRGLADERFQPTQTINCLLRVFFCCCFVQVLWWFCRCRCRRHTYIIASMCECKCKRVKIMNDGKGFCFVLSWLAIAATKSNYDYHIASRAPCFFAAAASTTVLVVFLCQEKYSTNIKLAKSDKEYYITYFDFDGNLLFLNPSVYSSHKTGHIASECEKRNRQARGREMKKKYHQQTIDWDGKHNFFPAEISRWNVPIFQRFRVFAHIHSPTHPQTDTEFFIQTQTRKNCCLCSTTGMK